MNRIVRTYYPAERLPDDLRGGVQQRGDILVEITSVLPRSIPGAAISAMVGAFPAVHGSHEEVLAHLRSLRDD